MGFLKLNCVKIQVELHGRKVYVCHRNLNQFVESLNIIYSLDAARPCLVYKPINPHNRVYNSQ